MAKVFRLHTQGTSGLDWFPVHQYNQSVINDINDPNGLTPKLAITSIPSPFARIDLVKSAFEYVVRDINANGNDPRGNTIFHKLVAETLDVAELVFNYEMFKENLKIIAWDPDVEIQNLINSNLESHKLLGNTMKTFWDQDGKAYNFDKVKRLYIIKYNNSIIGGTSPTTIFFPSPDIPDDLNIMLGNNKLFDHVYDALYERDPEFIVFLKQLFEMNQGFKILMPDFYSYININIDYLNVKNNKAYNWIINQLQNSDIDTFDQHFNIINTGTHGDNIEVLGVPFRSKKLSPPSDSDFIIKTDKFKGVKPLVLQNGFAESLNYANGTTWKKEFKVPEKDEHPLKQRILPGLPVKYPYLTVGDFLEDYIIRLPYKLNNDDYFDGNLDLSAFDDDVSYLLPLKKEFFDFFDADYLSEDIDHKGTKAFEIKRVAGGNVVVSLRIPIQKGKYVEFKKRYSQENIENIGVQIEHSVSVGIMPFIKVNDEHLNKYIVQTVYQNLSNNINFSLKIYDKENNTFSTEEKLRTDSTLVSKYYDINGSIDHIQVLTANVAGVLLPKFKHVRYPGAESYTYAIDFGTTNTHIEYINSKGERKPFEINKDDFFYRNTIDLFNTPSRFLNYAQLIRRESLPNEINNNSGYNAFPIRTALNHNQSLDFTQSVKAFTDANISFFYGIEYWPSYEDVYTNLKWSNWGGGVVNPDKIRVEKFLESLLILIRIKTMQHNGDLNKVKIKWLYPSSMLPGRRNSLANLWNKLTQEWISSDVNVISYSESIAPFYYFKDQLGVLAAAYPVASVDIGGETTDVVVYENDTPTFISSFRFASNSLFGDGYGGTPATNGFVKKYKNEFENVLKNNDVDFEFNGILEGIINKQSSNDVINFFFSLENIKSLEKIKERINFDNILNQDNDLKIVFLLYYTSIIYHVAKLMKMAGRAMPKYVTFSGNGSKVIYIIEGEKIVDFRYLTKLTQIIFNKVYGTNNRYDIEIKMPKEPKTITCTGCLLDKQDPISNVEDMMRYIINNELRDRKNAITYKQIQNDNNFESAALKEYKEFIKFFFKLNSEMSFQNYFNVPANKLDFYKNILLKDDNLPNYFKEGLNRKTSELGGDLTQPLEETNFFYILNGILFKLKKEIVEQK